jgi:hypothetical protein
MMGQKEERTQCILSASRRGFENRLIGLRLRKQVHRIEGSNNRDTVNDRLIEAQAENYREARVI